MNKLSAEQKERVAQFVPAFNQYLESIEYQEDMAEQHARKELYERMLAPEGIDQMTELELGQVLSSLWASRMWSNKGYFVRQVIHDNGLPRLRKGLQLLLWGDEPLASRYDTFRKGIKGLGAASITELLAFVHPKDCGLWNDRARKALEVLGFGRMFLAIHKSQITGPEYEAFNELIGLIRDELARRGLRWLDLLDVNYFLYDVWQINRDNSELTSEAVPLHTPPPVYEFDHTEMVDQLVAIGQWLGFQAEKEKKVAKGAQVDAVWQARIANLGVVTYVFEVQRHGSIDSLILNLQRAHNNPTVQRLIVVANYVDIEAVRQEIASLPESFRNAITFMEAGDAIRAAQLIDELSGIVGKLDLVRSEFDV
jgi:hypothetical protein